MRDPLFTELRADYERFKAKRFSEQLLRVANSMFAVFTYWNLVRGWLAERSEPSIEDVVMIAVVCLSGVVFGLLLLLRFQRRAQLIILPATILGFLCTAETNAARQAGIVPVFACIILLIVRLVIATANRLNRL